MTHQETSFLRRSQRALTTILFTMAGAIAAHATTITSTTFSGWKAPSSITGAPVDYFNGASVNKFSYNDASGLMLNGSKGAAVITGVDGSTYSLTGDPYGQTLSSSADPGSYINIAFANAQNAVAVFFGNSSHLNYTVTLSDGQSFSTSGMMLGLSLSHTISSLTISSSPGTQAVINDLLLGVSAVPADAVVTSPTQPGPVNTAATPEPSTLMLLAGGLLVFLSCQRRLRDLAKVAC